MKISMNQATCLEKSSLAKDMELCEKYGFDMIEPRTMDGIPLDDILQTLKKIGWAADAVSLELFRPEYYQMDPEDVYRIGKEKVDAVIKRNF